MTYSYPIIGNCNFESREDDMAMAVHATRQAVESGHTTHGPLVEALESLEETLGRLADQGDPQSVDECERAEEAVMAAWTDDVQEDVEESRIRGYIS